MCIRDSAYHLYTLMIDNLQSGLERDIFLERMHNQGIGTGVHYLSLPEHPYYQERFNWHPEEWPNARRIGLTTASLPLSPGIQKGDQKRVSDAVRSCFK